MHFADSLQTLEGHRLWCVMQKSIRMFLVQRTFAENARFQPMPKTYLTTMVGHKAYPKHLVIKRGTATTQFVAAEAARAWSTKSNLISGPVVSGPECASKLANDFSKCLLKAKLLLCFASSDFYGSTFYGGQDE